MSTYPNSWKPYVPRAINVKEVLAKKVEEYDQNFCLPGAVRDIENDRVKLTPFVPSLHARTYFEAFKSHPETFQFYPIGPFADLDSVVVYIERYCQQLPTALLYTIWDKTKPIVDESDPSAVPRYEMAGTIGIRNAQPANMSLEIGHLLIFPTFRRTHVTSNAIGLLALFCFSDAETEGGGLRMRRVQWQSHTSNAASIRAAKRFGFVEEGVARWQLIVHAATEGRWRPGDEACSWDSMVLSLCWDEVDYGLIRSIMDRRE